MPGYSKQRFVELSETEDEELTCGICLEIFKKPMVVQCCRQMFCDECITEWLRNKETCPHDRQKLTIDQITEPPRFVHNLISKLKIHCKFRNSGCNLIIKLEDLENHELNCDFDPSKICYKCNFNIHPAEEHDCVSNLMATNFSLVDEVSRLRGEISLKKRSNLEQTLDSAREWISSNKEPQITHCRGFPNNMLTKIKSITRDAVLNFATYEDISRNVNRRIRECDDGQRWQVFAYSKECGSSLVSSHIYYIDMSYGDMRFEIFSGGIKHTTHSILQN